VGQPDVRRQQLGGPDLKNLDDGLRERRDRVWWAQGADAPLALDTGRLAEIFPGSFQARHGSLDRLFGVKASDDGGKVGGGYRETDVVFGSDYVDIGCGRHDLHFVYGGGRRDRCGSGR
jgi:hypothetical protein